MNAISITLLSFLLKLSSSQTVLDTMSKDIRITKFYNILKNNQEIQSYFKNPYLCVLAPSDAAMNSATFTLSIEFIKRHIFVSESANPIIGQVANWKTYTSVPSKGEAVYHILSLLNTPIYFTNLTTSAPLVNGALVTVPDIATNNQAYHIIDRVLPESFYSEFLQLVTTNLINPTISQSFTNWKKLMDADNAKQFTNGSKFQVRYLKLSLTQPGTILMPTNDAWNNLPDTMKASLNDVNVLSNVMARLYIPGRIMFLHNNPLWFRAGFSATVGSDDANNFDGQYFRSSQSDMVNVQGYVGAVTTANIAIIGGVIHIIGSAMSLMETPSSYLQRRAPAFYDVVSKDTDLTKALNSNNITLLALNDETMTSVNQMDPNLRKQLLLNCFVNGVATMASANNLYFTTAGNATVRVKLVNGRTYVDTVSSMAEKTFVNRAQVVSADDTIQGININIIHGTVGFGHFNCTQVFSMLNHRAYGTLVGMLGVTLGIGSPYTLFVPSDDSLNQMGFNANNATLTTVASAVVTTTTSMTASNSTSSNNVATPPVTTTASSTLNANSGSTAKMRYLMQRMIVANKLLLGLRSTGNFKAATMNYAAMQEMINIDIDQNSAVTIGINGVTVPGPAIDDGFYCYSNDASLPDRRNLIYPIKSVLTTSTDATTSVCVTAPCAGTMISYIGSLVMAVALSCVVCVSGVL